MFSSKVDLKNFSQEKLECFLGEMGEKKFRSVQIMSWIYQKGASSFSEMSNLSLELRQKLEALCEWTVLTERERQWGTDGTQKFLFELKDGKAIESVLMPSPDRVTICISTQAGCRMGCHFCLTAKLGLLRNLSMAEIVGQILEIQKKTLMRVTNVVMMGMGEPFDNYDAVVEAVRILRSPQAFHMSQRKITVSTVGLVPEILRFGKEMDVNLAISLNAPNDELRAKLMPITRKYTLADLLEACRKIPLKPTRKITFEYVMLSGVNDSLAHAQELVEKVRDIKCKINLIPWNEFAAAGEFKRPTSTAIEAFHQYLNDHRVLATIRYSRGRDISAACGQLIPKMINH
ncbi:MAG: 23S rRNA (adenine(2503)-C(2))-methyltransferase RlmN [Deltaproteobacteria bacterium]|nr:23S rRNA (adenine(2503)-C(2))-methyltransferase RlmN [Deltaproteobacteria bacterium]